MKKWMNQMAGRNSVINLFENQSSAKSTANHNIVFLLHLPVSCLSCDRHNLSRRFVFIYIFVFYCFDVIRFPHKQCSDNIANETDFRQFIFRITAK